MNEGTCIVSNIHARGGGGMQTRLSLLFSNVQHASKQRRKPATRGMAIQHLQIFKRGVAQNK